MFIYMKIAETVPSFPLPPLPLPPPPLSLSILKTAVKFLHVQTVDRPRGATVLLVCLRPIPLRSRSRTHTRVATQE